MRKFYIENELGERRSLNGEDGVFLSDPAGLGVSYGSSYAELGDGFFRRIEEKQPQGTIPCSLTFMRGAYQKYKDFADWCIRAKSLFLVYKPFSAEYFRRVELSYLTKTEITSGTWMEVPTAFVCLTPWYLPSPLTLNFEDEGGGTVMQYEYTYDDDLVYGATGAGAYAVQITAQGHDPAALIIRYDGLIVNPVLTLTGVASGTLYGKCTISAEFAAGDALILCTGREDAYARKIAADGTVTDLLDKVDIGSEAEPFFTVPLTEPCILQLNSSAMSGKISAKAFFYYRTV